MLKKIISVVLAVCILAGNWGMAEVAYGKELEKAGVSIQEMVEGALNLSMKEKNMRISPKGAKKIKVKLNASKLTLEKGKSKTLKARVTGTKKKVKWTSSNKSIVTVNQKGKVTAQKAGSAKIKAKVNGVSAVCRVTVNQKLTRKQAEAAVCNYVERKETNQYWYFYNGKEGDYYTFWVTFRGPGTKAKYFVNRKNGKAYVCAIYVSVSDWKPSNPKKYVFNAYQYLR
jgi:hypothetical protein